MESLKELVAAKLTADLPQVRERVLGLFVEEELDKRVKAVVAVVKKLERARQEGYKFKPDDVTFDREGKVVSEGYKRETVEAIKKNAEQVQKLTDALDKALAAENPNFDAVLKLGGNDDADRKVKDGGGAES